MDTITEPATAVRGGRGFWGALWAGTRATVGALMGLAPHVMHHIGFLAGAAFLTLSMGYIGLPRHLAEWITSLHLPPLALIFLVLGTIFLGIATPTEGGAMGAAGALIMALLRKRLDWKLLKQAMATTGKLSSFVLFILVGATVFGLVFRAVNGDLWVEHLLLSLPGGQVGFLIVVNIMVFLLAFFLDFFELSFIIVPLLAPVADKLGIDLVWFGVLLAVNMQTSFMHPPFGFALFYLRSVAPASVKTTDIYWGAIPFVCIQIIMVAIIIIFPNVVSYGDDASRAQAQMERDGTAPPPIDLDTMMKQGDGGSDAENKEKDDNTAANLMKNLQGDSK